MNRRKKTAKATETAILTKSRRRCAICFSLKRDLSTKNGQIAHLDGNRDNNAEDNLAFLCFDHHEEYDTKRSQSKGLTEQEVKVYREQLYQEVERLAPETNTPLAQVIPHCPLPPPKMQIIRSSHFGRLDSKDGRFALLLKVKFRNESTQPVLLQHFRIQDADSWHAPQLQTGNVFLYVPTNIFAAALRKEDDITEALHIPEMAEIERHAFFILPDQVEPFPGPKKLRLTVEALFVQRSPQRVTFTLTDRGEIEQEGGLGNQEYT
jgi:hypothetical protein